MSKKTTDSNNYRIPGFRAKIRLYLDALMQVPLYRFGEIGNILYTIGKNSMEGVVLYTMFTMAESELQVAAVLAVAVKYAYPGISVVSSNYTSGFIDHLESSFKSLAQIPKLIKAQIGVGCGQALGGIALFCCFPPVFKALFFNFPERNYILIGLYLLHHILDGSAQILEGRSWFKIIEILLRNGHTEKLAENFWVIYALSQNVQLIIGQIFLWGSLYMTSLYKEHLTSLVIMGSVLLGLGLVVCAKFILPGAYYHSYRESGNCD